MSMADEMFQELRQLRTDLAKERDRANALSEALQEEGERRHAAEEGLEAMKAECRRQRQVLTPLVGLVRWYRLGKPIDGVPKYAHGAVADKALAAAGKLAAAAEGREDPRP